MPVTIEDIRKFAVARSLFPPTTLRRALERFGFVQADPIRAPARAQDLTLRHRVKDYRVGDLDRKYAWLGVAEDVFVNYGFVTHGLQGLMHPRGNWSAPEEGGRPWTASQKKTAERLSRRLLRERGTARNSARSIAEFPQGRVTNYWGGSVRMRRLICWMRCIIAGCCGWRGGRRGFGSMRRMSMGSGPADEAGARLGWMRWRLILRSGFMRALDSAGLKICWCHQAKAGGAAVAG